MKNLSQRTLKMALLGSCAATAMVSTSLLAQDADADEDTSFEEIYVTARKKQELIVEVPMNIATVGQREIAKRNLVAKEDVYRTVAGAANPRGELILRGLSGSNSSVPGTTATWTDGMPYDFSNLFDVERVEVLRGPQGTLWGSNAIGGTVQVITKKPNLDDFEVVGAVQFEQERYRPGTGVRASAAVNFPIVEGELALRVTGSVGNRSGKILNTYTGNVGSDEDHFIRAQLLWQPNEETRINFMYVNEREYNSDRTEVDVNSPSYYYDAVLTANPDATYGYDVSFDFPSCPDGSTSRSTCRGGQTNGHNEKYTVWRLMDPFDKDDVNLFGLNVEKDNLIDGVDMTYTGSYRRQSDLGRQSWWSRADANDMFRTWIIDDDTWTNWAHELRFQSNTDGPFQWTVGGFYERYEILPTDSSQWQYHASDDKSRAIAAYLWGSYWGLGDPTEIGLDLYGDPNKNYNSTVHRYISKELALFGEASYEADLGDAGFLEVTAGLRYYDLTDDFDTEVSGIWIGSEPSRTVTDDGESGTRKKVSINYRPNDEIGIFAVYSEGYRRGGNNGPTAPNDCLGDENIGSYTDRYESDKIKNYEFGVKGLAFDRRFQFSSAVYRIDWSGVQASVYMPSCGFSYTANAASARSQGLEFESSTNIADGLQLLANFAYTDSKMTSDVPSLGAEDGDDMTMVPDYNFYVALDKEFELFGREASARIEMEGYGEYKTHFNVKDTDVSPAYELVNLSAGMDITENARLSIHVKNLLDNEHILYRRSRSRSDWSGNLLGVDYGPDRTFTVRLDFEF